MDRPGDSARSPRNKQRYDHAAVQRAPWTGAASRPYWIPTLKLLVDVKAAASSFRSEAFTPRSQDATPSAIARSAGVPTNCPFGTLSASPTLPSIDDQLPVTEPPAPSTYHAACDRLARQGRLLNNAELHW